MVLLRVGGSAIEEVNTLNNYIIPLMNNQACLEREAAVNPYRSEKEIVTQWVLPLMQRTCDLEKEVAVNTARDQEYKSSQQVIQSLMFRLAEQNTNAKFAMSEANINCVNATLNNKIDSGNTLQRTITDAEFALGRALTKYDISAATCNCIKGTPFLSPAQLADPYQAGSNIISTHKACCGCTGSASECGAWAGY